MILQAGEQGIASEQLEVVLGDRTQSGYLYLTSSRLIFEGLFLEHPVGWLPRTLLDLHLGQITNALAMSGRRDRHTLRVEAGRGYVYTFVTPNAAGWVNSIIQAKAKVPTVPAASPPMAGHSPIVVNVQQAPSQPSVYLHCKHCGSLNASGSVHCTSCGATL